MLLREQSRSAADALILDAVLSAAVEAVCDEQEERLRGEFAERSLFLTDRFSPGYGDFSIEYQRPIVQMLDAAKKIGLTLTDSCMMVPSKSVTAVIGISETSLPCHRQGCEICTKTDCLYRRNTA